LRRIASIHASDNQWPKMLVMVANEVPAVKPKWRLHGVPARCNGSLLGV
jgi:hypothetical protein